MAIFSHSNYPNGFDGGVIIRGLPVLNTYTGKVFHVKNGSGTDSGTGTYEFPFATIDYAVGRCVAGRGDIILVKHGHVETVTASITLDVAGVAVIGLGGPTSMPTITGNFAGDAMTVTAANCAISNIRFAGPLTDAQTSDINVAAAGCVILGTYHIGSVTTENKVDIITLASGADDCLIDGIRVWNTVVECVGGIAIEAAIARLEVRNCMILDTIGFTNGAIYDGATATALYIHDNTFQNGKATTVVTEFGNNSTGLSVRNNISGRHATIGTNITVSTGMDYFFNRVTNEVARNGAVIPVVDAE